MRHSVIVCVLVVAASFTSTASAQESSPQASIYLGLDLTLGMPEAEVLKSLRAIYKLSEVEKPQGTSSSSWFLHGMTGPPSKPLGNVYFERGRLKSVAKYWTPQDDGRSFTLANAVYGVLAGLVRAGNNKCVLDVGSSENPGFDAKSAFITCGGKQIEISLTQSSEYGNHATVTEWLK